MTESTWTSMGITTKWGGVKLELQSCGSQRRLLNPDGSLNLQYEYSPDGKLIRFTFPFYDSEFRPLSQDIIVRK
jgi:hypothetical protein